MGEEEGCRLFVYGVSNGTANADIQVFLFFRQVEGVWDLIVFDNQ